MKRRDYLRAAGATGALGLAGCSASSGSGQTLTVATYSSYIGDGKPSAWLKKQFEKAHSNVTVKWKAPSSGSGGITEYIQRANQGATIGADVYVGLNTDQLVLVDEKVNGSLFADLSGDLSHAGDLKSGLRGLDSKGRAYPYDTGYINPVADATALSSLPTTFEDLAKPRYAKEFLMENAQNSDTGKAFLLWTIHAKGPDNYLGYWKHLLNGGMRVIDTWKDAYYNHYVKGDGHIVASYSTDRVYAAKNNENLKKYTIDFLNDQAYANPESAAVFSASNQRSLATEFVDFMLSPHAQNHIPQMNYEFPSTTTGSISGTFKQYAKVPTNPVTFTYDELKGNVQGWTSAWARLVANH